MADFVLERCRDAIQAGPSLFEPAGPTEGARIGLGGLSLEKQRRLALIRVHAAEEDRLYLFVSVGEMTIFDTATAIWLLMDATAATEAGAELQWAVGLQDQSYASGPAMRNAGTLMALSDVSPPTAGLLAFHLP